MRDMEKNMDGKNGMLEGKTIESDEPVPNQDENDLTEEYISNVQKALSDILPSDFSPAGIDVPVSGENGSRIAVILTGIIENGKLASPLKTEIDMSAQNEFSNPGSAGKKLAEKFGSQNHGGQ